MERKVPEAERRHGEAHVEGERYWPLISFDDAAFIENVGGEYEGYVQTGSGKVFQEVWIDHLAYYDETRSGVLDTVVAAEGIDEDGNAELRGPSDIKGYSVLFERRSPTGDKIGDSLIFSLLPRNFSRKRMSGVERKELSRELREFLLSHARGMTDLQLKNDVERLLSQNGWRG